MIATVFLGRIAFYRNYGLNPLKDVPHLVDMALNGTAVMQSRENL